MNLEFGSSINIKSLCATDNVIGAMFDINKKPIVLPDATFEYEDTAYTWTASSIYTA